MLTKNEIENIASIITDENIDDLVHLVNLRKINNPDMIKQKEGKRFLLDLVREIKSTPVDTPTIESAIKEEVLADDYNLGCGVEKSKPFLSGHIG